MNNWKLRSVITGTNTDDLVEVNGYLAAPSTTDVPVLVVPFGNHYARPLRTSASDDFGPVSNQVPGICNGTFTHTGAGSATVSATTLTGKGSGATFTYTFLADGTLSTIVAASGGSDYLVGDKLRITTSASHGSQVIEFRVVDGSNAAILGITIPHDRNAPLPYAVHRARVNSASQYTFHVYDYRSSQVFPKPQNKLLDKYPNAAAAYGLRLLRSAYLGPAIRVRRASDNAEKDIYMDSQGNLDTQSLFDFSLDAGVFVKTWYDQSGNGNDASQSTNASQPRILNQNKDMVTVNGKPALRFDGSDDELSIDSSDLYGQDRFDAYMHYQTADARYVFFGDPDSNTRFSLVPEDGSSVTSLSGSYNPTSLYVNGVKIPAVPGTNTRGELHTALVTNAGEHSTGAVVVHEDAGTSSWTDFGISAYPTGTTYLFDGKVTEVVLYNTDQSANREGIEKDMALHSGAFQVEDAPLLDAYGGAHAAYSLRKLNSDYTGAAIRARRGVDGSELDIGFKADGTLDLDALTAFSTGSIYVKTWYDQSGNGNDVTQTATAKQPYVQSGVGTIQKVDGRIAARFDGTDAFPFDNTGLDIGNLSSFLVCKLSTTTGTQFPLVLSAQHPTRFYPPHVNGGNFVYLYGDSTVSLTQPADVNNNLHTLIAGATQGDAEAFFNGSSVGTKALASGLGSFSDGIGGVNGANFLNGFIQEIVVYSSDQSERREGIERNISNHYDL